MTRIVTRIACLITATTPASPTTPAETVEPLPATALLQVALAHSPRVEDAGAGRVYLDATGLTGLFGDEPGLAARLSEAASRAGLAVRVGIADSRIAALGRPDRVRAGRSSRPAVTRSSWPPRRCRCWSYPGSYPRSYQMI